MTTSTFDHDLRLTRGPDRVRPAQSRTSGGEDRRESDLARSRPVLTAMAVAGATAVGWRWAGRPQGVRTITMGPGGWVSFKGLKPPPLRTRRPWWAVLLRARPVPAR